MVIRLYKILEISEWLCFKKKNYFAGSKLDKSSGFIHMCKKEHLLSTVKLYYPKLRKLTILEFRYYNIKDKIKTIAVRITSTRTTATIVTVSGFLKISRKFNIIHIKSIQLTLVVST